MNTHWSVHVGGNSQNGPMRITMKNSTGVIGVDATDWGPNNTAHPIGLAAHVGRLRQVIDIGSWIGTNAELMDPQRGVGLIQKAFAEDRVFEAGFNGCGRLAQAILGKMGIKIPPQAIRQLQAATPFMKSIGANLIPQRLLPMRYSRYRPDGTQERSSWTTTDNKAWTQDEFWVTYDPALDVEDEAHAITQNREPAPIALMKDETPLADGSFKAAAVTDLAKSEAGANVFMLARAQGVKSLLTLTTSNVVKGLGAAATALGPLFVILDFVNHDWVGGALAAVGTAVALGIEAAVELTGAELGPVGWFLDGLVALLFFILPGLFKPAPHWPPNNNATQVIQFSMFGDKTHTGNEKCQQQNPQCQVLYGPNVIMQTFGWDLFNAIIFMIQFNQGLTMTIPDMAAAFTSIGGPESSTNGIVAQIKCKNGPHDHHRGPSLGPICESPSYLLNRTLVTLPNIGQTADQVFTRLINAQGEGDCKIVAASLAGVNFPDYNYTLLNTPVSIACGISSVNVASSAVSYGPFTAGNVASGGNTGTVLQFNPANQSTDGNGGEAQTAFTGTQVAFGPLLTAANGLCLSGTGGNICLPNGTYTPQTGKLGYTSKGTTSMTLPPTGGSLIVNSEVYAGGMRRDLDAVFGPPGDARERDVDLSSRDLHHEWDGGIFARDLDLDGDVAFLERDLDEDVDVRDLNPDGDGAFFERDIETDMNVSERDFDLESDLQGRDHDLDHDIDSRDLYRDLDLVERDLDLDDLKRDSTSQLDSFERETTDTDSTPFTYPRDHVEHPESNADASLSAHFQPSESRLHDRSVGFLDGYFPRMKRFEFAQNQAPGTNFTFKRAFENINNAGLFSAQNFIVNTPSAPYPPGACLFTDTDYNGDVACLSVGAAMLPANLQKVAKSISVLGNATVFVYSTAVNDKTQQLLPGSVPDLGGVPLGDGGFSQNVAAMWIAPPATS
ncbi:hypothetical protein MMC19_002763 [Ptychographa xylographoides]|nr:hypothetical protein [Ptychographa xylographoides]